MLKNIFGFATVPCLVAGVMMVDVAHAAPPAQPADVREFVVRRDTCDHLRGEDPGEGKNRAAFDARIDKACKGSDAQLAALKRKYKADKTVMSLLSAYDAQIE
ncbi:hypothetical protein [Undibacterium sp. TC9W]|uniref:hypothetical protein n=1 Tax=Undibacterium sp. TC9W TaxID=3413053 RepID=UPI003BF1D052